MAVTLSGFLILSAELEEVTDKICAVPAGLCPGLRHRLPALHFTCVWPCTL